MKSQIGVLVLLFPFVVYGGEFDSLYRAQGAQHGVDWRLVKAIAQVESNENPRAVHVASQSFGLMGILCRHDGRNGCRNRFDIKQWPPRSREHLLEPEYNVALGTEILAWNIRRYGLARGVAVYNAWSVRSTPPGVPFANQDYVDKVFARYRALKNGPAARDQERPQRGLGSSSESSSYRVTTSPGPRHGLNHQVPA